MPMLRITFSGLCTFIFNQPLKEEGSKPTEVTVLLQRLTQARQLSNKASARPEILDQHFPLLVFSLPDYDPASTRFADVHCTPDATGKMTKGTCLLMGEDLTVLVDGRRMERNSLELSKEMPTDPTSPNLSKRDRDSLWWMATLADVFGKSPKINPLILNTPPGSNQPILARIQVSEGQLRTLELTDFPCTIVPPGEAVFSRRVAMSFELAVPFTNSVTFKSVANRNGRTAESELIFRPAAGGDLQIGIMNMEINRFVGLDPANGPRAEADFGVYAELLAEPITGDIPFLRQVSTGDPSSAPHSSCVPGGG